MSLIAQPILVNGATHSAQSFRMLVRDLARGNEGITQGDDLKVSQRSTPGGGVSISDGSGVVRGRANSFQGSYAVCNVGADTSVNITATGGTPRSDMVIIRVEDPEYEGSLNPATDAIAYFQVISGVSSSATAIPDGRTGIPLARIDIPASTSTITNAMITDLRSIANPRRERTLLTQSPSGLSTNIGGTSGTFSNFSTAAGWNITVPGWATKVVMSLSVGQIRYNTGVFFGQIRATFGSSATVQAVNLDDNQSGTRRATVVFGDTITLPWSYFVTTQLLRLQACGLTGNAGYVGVDASTTLIADVEFIEAPR